MDHIKTKKYACYHYHSYHHSRERGEETGNQTEEEQKTKGYHHYMIIIIIANTTIIIIIIKTKIAGKISRISYHYYVSVQNVAKAHMAYGIWDCYRNALIEKCAFARISSSNGDAMI